MQYQDVFNISIGIAGFLGGWWMKVMWETVKELQKDDKILSQQLSAIQVLVAGDYIKKEDFYKVTDAIFLKLDKIEDKIDGKVDK
jgi:hypothetical protein